MIASFLRLRRFIAPYRRVLAVGVVLGIFEVGLGIAQPWPLKIIVDRALGGAAVTTSKADAHTLIVWCVVAYLAIIALGALADYWSTRLLSAAGLHIGNDLRQTMFSHLQRQSLRYHGQRTVGDLSTRVTADVDRAQDMIVQGLAVMLPNALLMIGMVTVMLVLDTGFTLMALATTPILIIVTQRSTSRLKSAARRARSADGAVAAAATESLGSIQLVQAFSLESRLESKFRAVNQIGLDASLDAVRWQARFSPFVDLSSAVATGIVMLAGAWRVLDGRMSLGVLTVFLSYVSSAYKPIKALSKLSASVGKGTAAAERVDAVLLEEPEIVDVPDARVAPRWRGEVAFDRVSFAYGAHAVLHEVSFTARAGETVALVGPSGAGKSTIAALIARLIEPTHGSVTVDGVDIRRCTIASHRAQVSLVLQDCVLLRGTLRENIAFGAPGVTASDLERASRDALVDEFARQLPQGLDTMIGERGATLSGGQRQRVAIARALLRRAPILVLDEPTSALDGESETLLVEALANLPRHCTTLIIAHRLSTIRNADRIIVLDRGRVVETGTHAQLVHGQGRYQQLSQATPRDRDVI